MKNNASLLYSFFLLIGDFVALIGAFVVAYILRVSLDARPLVTQVPSKTYLYAFLLVLPFWLIIFAFLGLYNSNIYEKRFVEAGRLFIGSIVGLLFVIGFAFFSDKDIFPAKLVPIYGLVLSFGFLLIVRNIERFIKGKLFEYEIGINSVLIVGDNQVTKELVALLEDDKKSGYRIIGIVGGSSDYSAQNLRVFDDFKDAIKKLNKKFPHSIIQTELYAESNMNNEVLDFAQANHIAYRFIPGNTELFVGKIDVELFRSIPVISVHQTALVGWGRIVKRAFDLLFSLSILVVVSPFILAIAVISFVLSPGNVFFSHTRITRFNTKFKLYKFRTIKTKYNGLTPEQAFQKMGKPELIEQYRSNGDHLPNDPRFTTFGRFLRVTSLDELPQFINVIKGDLSLVGPRALIPEEINQADAKQHIVSVKSGITGLAQVSGRRNISYEERRKLDLYYVQNWSFWLDVTILLKTLRVVFSGSGAK